MARIGKDPKTEKRTEAGKGKEKGAADKGNEKAADIKGMQASTAHNKKSDKSKKAPDEPKSRTETAGNRPWRRTRRQCTTWTEKSRGMAGCSEFSKYSHSFQGVAESKMGKKFHIVNTW